MRIAFVGVKRKPSELPEGYLPTFIRYHIEIPFYYAMHSASDVVVSMVEETDFSVEFPFGGGSIKTMTEDQILKQEFDIVVHWRKWFPEFSSIGKKHLLLSQDHSYGHEWKTAVWNAFAANQLHGILVFPHWHKQNTFYELGGIIPKERLFDGYTLGVDVDTYKPSANKDPYHLLWASDPGRGLMALLPSFFRLATIDKKFHLTVTYPDYVSRQSIESMTFLKHPAINIIHGLRNGPELWNLFNSSGIVPYASTFPEPSSRVHRQGQAAGSLVLYPPKMGTPSDLIEDGVTGMVQSPILWPQLIIDAVRSGRWKEIGQNARMFAERESWATQAERFYNRFKED